MKRLLIAPLLTVAVTACSLRALAVLNQADPPIASNGYLPAGEPSDQPGPADDPRLPETAFPPTQASLNPGPVNVPAPESAVGEPLASIDPTVSTNIGVFAELPGNQATGELAPDFDGRALRNWNFSLSALRGSYVLLVPTAIGCGDCVFTLNQLAAAYPDYRDANLQLVILNLYPDDVPESWGPFAAAYVGLDAIWGVVNSGGFVVDYDIRSLGTVLLVDPAGKLVFRSDFSLVEEEFRRLFALITG